MILDAGTNTPRGLRGGGVWVLLLLFLLCAKRRLFLLEEDVEQRFLGATQSRRVREPLAKEEEAEEVQHLGPGPQQPTPIAAAAAIRLESSASSA